MTSTVSLEGVKRAVFYPFQGKKWRLKLLIGNLLTCAGFVVPIACRDGVNKIAVSA